MIQNSKNQRGERYFYTPKEGTTSSNTSVINSGKHERKGKGGGTKSCHHIQPGQAYSEGRIRSRFHIDAPGGPLGPMRPD